MTAQKTLPLAARKPRVQITVGPKTAELVAKLAARYRKETMSDWTQVEVIQSAVGRGLREMAAAAQLKVEPLLSCSQ
jgi:hypothetical protein